jgi:hypothetical protein
MLLRRRHFARTASPLTRKQLHRQRLRQQLEQYRGFVASVGSQIGELSPLVGEDLPEIRFLVRMAARALGLNARTWLDNGKVYFYIRRDNARLS